MKKIWLLLALAAAGCAAPRPDPPPAAAAALAPGEAATAAAVAEGGNAFAVDLYRRLGEEPGDLFLSPVSLSTAFGLVAAGARGETAREIAQTLHYPAADARLHPAMSALLASLRTEREGRRLAVANALWVQRGFALKPDYLSLTRAHYGAAPAAVDFVGRPAEAVAEVNRWAERNTEGLIRNLLGPDDVTALTRLILTNAVYFKGDWERPFEAAETREEPFRTIDGGTRPMRFMNQTAPFRYFDTDAFQAVDLPYQGGEFSMAVFLPRRVDGLRALERELDAARLRGWLERLAAAEPRTVQLALPRLRLEQRHQLGPVLEAMGMRTAFTDRADLTGMSDARLMIAKVIQQTFLRVDEEGTEAAAATAVVIQVTGARIVRDIVVFRADRPFLFLIRHNPTGAVVFLGRIEAPDPA